MIKNRTTKDRRKKSGRARRAQTVVTLSLIAAAQVPGAAWALDINCNRKLIFGTVAACPAAAGTVTVDPDGNMSSSPGCLTVTGLTDRGGCTLSVDTSGPVVITMATPTDTVADGPNDMDVNNFILQTSSAGPAATITISPTAQISLRVGGTLNITAGQAGGTYSGAVTINANYE